MTNQYNLHIVGKHIEVTDGIRNHLLDKLSKIEKLTDSIIEVHIRFDIEKKIHQNVAISMHFAHSDISAHASTSDLYASIDKAVDRLKTKVSRWKEKLIAYHHRGAKVQEVDVAAYEGFNLDEVNDAIEDENQKRESQRFSLPSISKMKKILVKTLTLAEAMMKMELSDDHFLLYRAEEDQKMKVIYRRNDGSYGVIAPEQ